MLCEFLARPVPVPVQPVPVSARRSLVPARPVLVPARLVLFPARPDLENRGRSLAKNLTDFNHNHNRPRRPLP